MRLRKGLLIAGVASSLLYVGIDQLAAIRHADYHSFLSQTISELSARGSPTKAMVDPLYVVYDLLTIAFGLGVWMSAGGSRALRVAAAGLTAVGVVGLPGPWLFPMNLRGVGGDLPHIVGTGVIVVFILIAMVSGALALGRPFRVFSFVAAAAMLGFGALTSVQAKGLVTGDPTPWIGLTERICVGAFMAWVVVLAIALLRAQEASVESPTRSGGPLTTRSAPA